MDLNKTKLRNSLGTDTLNTLLQLQCNVLDHATPLDPHLKLSLSAEMQLLHLMTVNLNSFWLLDFPCHLYVIVLKNELIYLGHS